MTQEKLCNSELENSFTVKKHPTLLSFYMKLLTTTTTTKKLKFKMKKELKSLHIHSFLIVTKKTELIQSYS